MGIFEKVARRITRRSWNATIHHIILEAEKRRIIDSYQSHAILGAWNAECFPENGHASFLKGNPTPNEADRGYVPQIRQAFARLFLCWLCRVATPAAYLIR